VEPIDVGAKVRLAGDRATAGAVPLRVTDCGEPVALSAIERDAVSAPATIGLNRTDTVQVAATASEVPQVVADFRKEVALAPVMVSDVKVKAEVPVFLMVTS